MDVAARCGKDESEFLKRLEIWGEKLCDLFDEKFEAHMRTQFAVRALIRLFGEHPAAKDLINEVKAATEALDRASMHVSNHNFNLLNVVRVTK